MNSKRFPPREIRWCSACIDSNNEKGLFQPNVCVNFLISFYVIKNANYGLYIIFFLEYRENALADFCVFMYFSSEIVDVYACVS